MKYFWKNGYIIIIGTVVIMSIAILMLSGEMGKGPASCIMDASEISFSRRILCSSIDNGCSLILVTYSMQSNQAFTAIRLQREQSLPAQALIAEE